MENKPDYKGFGETLEDWNQFGVPYGISDLVELAKKYNTPIPGSKEWEEEFPQVKQRQEHV